MELPAADRSRPISLRMVGGVARGRKGLLGAGEQGIYEARTRLPHSEFLTRAIELPTRGQTRQVIAQRHARQQIIAAIGHLQPGFTCRAQTTSFMA